MESRFIKITDKNQWQDLLGKVLFKTFFHFLEWEEFLESQFKWLKFERYIYKNEALLSLARAGNKLISHPFCEYGGPLPLVEKIDGADFQKDLLEEFRNPLKISFHPELLNYFEGAKFPENQRETYLFDDLQVKDQDQLWLRIDRNRHRSIKSAESQGFVVETCRNSRELEILYDLYVRNLKKHRAIAYPFSFFEFFLRSPRARVMLVKGGGEIVGGNIFLLYGRIVHSFLCGFKDSAKREGVHSLILWKEIEKAKEQGFEIFDFGATRKDSSIKEFKERWKAQAEPICELKNYASESSLRKSKLRDVYGLLPSFLIKKLSPYLLKYKL